MDKSIYAIIDASINRALEGLRVCEDAARFILKNEGLSLRLKNLRHETAAGAALFPDRLKLAGRDVEGDPTKFADVESEMRRASVRDVVKSGMRRAAEALRSLEEYSKLALPGTDSPFQRLRFEAYAVEKELLESFGRSAGLDRLHGSLIAIVDSRLVPAGGYSETAKKMIEGGASVILLRMSDLPMKEILSAARNVSEICRAENISFIVSGRPEIAHLSGADGLHLGKNDLPPDEARRIIPGGILVGMDVSSGEDIASVISVRPDYIAIGPVLSDDEGYSVKEGIGAAAAGSLLCQVEIAAVCFGGVNAGNIGMLKKAGFNCFMIGRGLYEGGLIEKNCRMAVDAIK